MNESGAEYPLFLSAVSYSVFAVLKISSTMYIYIYVYIYTL